MRATESPPSPFSKLNAILRDAAPAIAGDGTRISGLTRVKPHTSRIATLRANAYLQPETEQLDALHRF